MQWSPQEDLIYFKVKNLIRWSDFHCEVHTALFKGSIIRSFLSHLPSLFMLLFLLLNTRHLKLIIISLCPFLDQVWWGPRERFINFWHTFFHMHLHSLWKITLNLKRLSWNSWVREKVGSVTGWSLSRGRIGRYEAAYNHRQKPTSGGKTLKRTCFF